jgi:hypothetical protein
MIHQYTDKHGVKIEAGMTLKHIDGDIEKVYLADNGDLGINASNEEWVGYVEEWNQKLYPLFQFDLREWEIVEG